MVNRVEIIRIDVELPTSDKHEFLLSEGCIIYIYTLFYISFNLQQLFS